MFFFILGVHLVNAQGTWDLADDTDCHSESELTNSLDAMKNVTNPEDDNLIAKKIVKGKKIDLNGKHVAVGRKIGNNEHTRDLAVYSFMGQGRRKQDRKKGTVSQKGDTFSKRSFLRNGHFSMSWGHVPIWHPLFTPCSDVLFLVNYYAKSYVLEH